MTIRIRLIRQQGPHPVGSEHEVVRTVPHGGYTDSAAQYVLADGIHVASDYAELVDSKVKDARRGIPCTHIAAFYQWRWQDHPCIAFNLLRHGYRQCAEGRHNHPANNLYDRCGEAGVAV